MKTGFASDELNVECRRVLEDHPVLQGREMDIEREEGGVLELRETPFVRIGDEGELLGLDHLSLGRVVDQAVLDQQG